MTEAERSRRVPRQHILNVRVYYEDTDFSGFVYHASYLRFFERARTEMLRDLGIQQGKPLSGAATPSYFVVSRMTLDYLRPAHMDDVLEIKTIVTEARGASLLLEQVALRAGAALVRAQVRIGLVRGGKAIRFPKDVLAAFNTGPTRQAAL